MSESLEQPQPHADPPVNDKASNGDHMDTEKAPESPHAEDLPMQNGDHADSHTNGGMKRHSPDHEEDNSEERNAKRAREDHSASPEDRQVNGSSIVGTGDHAASEDVVDVLSSQQEPETPSQPQDRPLPNGSAPPTYVPGSFHPPHREPFGPTSPITGQQCRSLLAIIRQIKKAREAGPFNTPVDPVAFNIPHYTNIITRPMDLSTVETKLNASNPSPPKDKSRPVKKDTSLGTYSNVQEVVEDVRQIWNNTRIFNGPHHAVSLNANKLDDMFETAIQKAKLGEEISARRASISQPSARPNGAEESQESARPKREVHPPATRDTAEHSSSKKSGTPSEAEKIRAVGKIIYDLINKKPYNEITYPFLYPVDPIALNIPDYPKIVKHPMDMSTIQSRINMHHYSTVNDIYADFKLMLHNCFIYNPPGTPVHEVGRQVEKLWTEKLQTNSVLNARPPMVDHEDAEFANVDVDYEIRTIEKQLTEMQNRLNRLRAYRTKNTEKARAKATAAANHAKTSKATASNAHASTSKAAKPKASGGASKPAAASKPRKQSTGNAAANGKKASAPAYHEPVYDDESDVEEPPAPVSLAQKQELADKIAEVDSETLNQALEIISKTTAVGDGNDEIELDIDALPPHTVFQLYNLVVLGYPNGKRPKKKRGGNRTATSAAKSTGGKAPRKQQSSRGNGSEKERIRALEAQLAVLEKTGHDDDGGSSVAYSEEDSDEE
ncbi:hypothetical protein QFC22_003810 [Naganishia vaughanmartiniae]|uniref:Uncharacterized protein n=1 Tax=Naganishia vaughanmartiniae TaxID=1424756 RepID=A0ACC2X5C2_9TREE|nr:hypothetical protein QFC22_003810 [Naganishia vaughanmartiniae]